MQERELVIGGFYKHFKDKLYQVKCNAYHSETKEKMVVYQALYGDYAFYVRPYDMFMSEVDHNKYPDVVQKYRFEQVNPGVEAKEDVKTLKSVDTEVPDNEEKVNPDLLLFLDSDTYQEKLNTLTLLKDRLDDKLVNAMAASMDVEVPDGPIDKRYASLKSCIMAHAKYECTRLR